MTERPKEPFHWRGDEIKGQAQEEFNKSAQGQEQPEKTNKEQETDRDSMIQKTIPQPLLTPDGKTRQQADREAYNRRYSQQHKQEDQKLQKAKELAKDIQNRQQTKEREEKQQVNKEKESEKDKTRQQQTEEKLAKLKETAREITSRNNSHNGLQWNKGGRGER